MNFLFLIQLAHQCWSKINGGEAREIQWHITCLNIWRWHNFSSVCTWLIFKAGSHLFFQWNMVIYVSHFHCAENFSWVPICLVFELLFLYVDISFMLLLTFLGEVRQFCWSFLCASEVVWRKYKGIHCPWSFRQHN